MQILLPLLLSLAAAPAASPVRLPPVDECSADPSFAAFREMLQDSVARKDREAFLKLVDPQVAVNFGGDAGHAAFVRNWELDRPEASPLWQKLEDVLPLGCGLREGAASIPSLMTQFPEDGDPYEEVLTIGEGTSFYAKPDPASALVGKLDWELVRVTEWDEKTDWSKIALADGRTGYILHRQLRSPLDYRAVFEKRNGAWRMTAFLAGD
jgi:hypothetical protein